MKRKTIETPESESEPQRLKELAALQGRRIKGVVLAGTIGATDHPTEEGRALMDLERLLRQRTATVLSKRASARSVEEIFNASIDKGECRSNP